MSLSSDFDTHGRLSWELANLRLWVKFQRLRLALKYDPNQPRVPAGNPDGGQWTYDGGGSARVAQYVPRGPRGGGGRGRGTDATPGQQARLAASQAQASAAVQRVRERDPNWRPTPSISSGIKARSPPMRRSFGKRRQGSASSNELELDLAALLPSRFLLVGPVIISLQLNVQK